MKVDAHKGLSEVVSSDDVDVVLIRNKQGDPIVVAVQFDERTVAVARAGDEDFDRFIKMYGIDKGPLVQKLRTNT